MSKGKKKLEYGDFQTPDWLAKQVCKLLVKLGCKPDYLLEPTCGEGAFLLAGLQAFPHVQEGIGLDINLVYVAKTKQRLKIHGLDDQANVHKADFFDVNWEDLLPNNKHILIIGNPPWVTNTALAKVNSQNLPTKQNRNGRCSQTAQNTMVKSGSSWTSQTISY